MQPDPDASHNHSPRPPLTPEAPTTPNGVGIPFPILPMLPWQSGLPIPPVQPRHAIASGRRRALPDIPIAKQSARHRPGDDKAPSRPDPVLCFPAQRSLDETNLPFVARAEVGDEPTPPFERPTPSLGLAWVRAGLVRQPSYQRRPALHLSGLDGAPMAATGPVKPLDATDRPLATALSIASGDLLVVLPLGIPGEGGGEGRRLPHPASAPTL